jgi:RluA family pseudouridine synthase
MSPITNIAAYRFAALTELKELRARLIEQCRSWQLKGTILLSAEGINLFVAGGAKEIALLLAELRAVPGLEALEPKVSVSGHQPFNRMLVRIKKEIIAFGVEGIEPQKRTSRKIAAATLKQWLDEGRQVTLLDTRNNYEVKLGTFRGAQALGLDHFREFPAAVAQLPAEMKKTPIVMFCTGGIRCEKAGPFMEREGFLDVFQLDGGILKYFEECGGAHYDGECFVFDQRVGVDPALRETESAQCFGCLSPLTKEDQADARYVAGRTCPYCFATSAEKMAEVISSREEQIRAATTLLPGSVPYDNRKPVIVPPGFGGATVIDFFSGVLRHVARREWERLAAAGRLLNRENRAVSAETQVRAGERYFVLQPGIVEPEVSAAIRIVHEDEAIIVLNKPAPLPVHPSGRFNRNTLQAILHQVYFPQKPRAAHRLDANTTGLMVCARTRHFARIVQPQFERGEVWKTYLVNVVGHPAWEREVCAAPIGAEARDVGARAIDPEAGLPARTDFKVRARRADGTAVLEARLLTGRTNQIRLHAWHLGFPVVGDPVYRAERAAGATQTLAVDDSPLGLHAWKLSFLHPVTGLRMHFEAEAGERFA